MADDFEKRDTSVSRTRGYSLLTAQIQAHRDEFQARSSPEHTPEHSRGRERLLSEIGCISAGLALGDDLDLSRSESMQTLLDTNSGRLPGPDPVVRSEPINIKPKINPLQGLTSNDIGISSAGNNSELTLRNWCQGHPPRHSFLGSDHQFSPRSRPPRRSTIADKVELDSALYGAMTAYGDHDYLPVNPYTVHLLSKHTNGAKPVADKTIFSMLLINGEINNVYAEHVIAALESIGEHVKDLVIIAPINTTEFGDAFKRDSLDVNTGSDWENILKHFPNLKSLTFEHSKNLSIDLTRETFCAIHCALANGILPQLENVRLDVPPQVLTNLRADVHEHRRHGGPAASGTSQFLDRAEEAAHDEETADFEI